MAAGSQVVETLLVSLGASQLGTIAVSPTNFKGLNNLRVLELET